MKTILFSMLLVTGILPNTNIFAQNFGDELRDQFQDIPGVFKGKLPKKLKYNSIQKQQIEMLSCVRKLVQKRVGGYDSPEIAQSLIVSAMDGDKLSEEISVLKSAHSSCLQKISNLKTLKNKQEDLFKAELDGLLETSRAEQKAKFVVKAFYNKLNHTCQFSDLGGQAALLIGLGAGVSSIKCLRTDGKVVRYLGVRAGFSSGLGAIVNITNTDNEVDDFGVANNQIGSFYEVENRNWAVGVGRQFSGQHNENTPGLTLGLGLVGGFSFGVGFRSFNAGQRWNHILEHLASN